MQEKKDQRKLLRKKIQKYKRVPYNRDNMYLLNGFQVDNMDWSGINEQGEAIDHAIFIKIQKIQNRFNRRFFLLSKPIWRTSSAKAWHIHSFRQRNIDLFSSEIMPLVEEQVDQGKLDPFIFVDLKEFLPFKYSYKYDDLYDYVV